MNTDGLLYGVITGWRYVITATGCVITGSMHFITDSTKVITAWMYFITIIAISINYTIA